MSPCCFFEIFKSLLLISTHHTPPQHHNNWHKNQCLTFRSQKKVHRWKFRSFPYQTPRSGAGWINLPIYPSTSKAFSNGSSIMFNVAMAHVMLASASEPAQLTARGPWKNRFGERNFLSFVQSFVWIQSQNQDNLTSRFHQEDATDALLIISFILPSLCPLWVVLVFEMN